jgi:hypothetical protein
VEGGPRRRNINLMLECMLGRVWIAFYDAITGHDDETDQCTVVDLTTSRHAARVPADRSDLGTAIGHHHLGGERET